MSGLPPLNINIIDQAFFDDCLCEIPARLHAGLSNQYKLKYLQSVREANLMMLDAVSTAQDSRNPFGIKADEELKIIAERRANLCIDFTAENGAVFAVSCGIEVLKGYTERGTKLRLVNPSWWYRRMKIKQKRDVELKCIQSGQVHKLASPYCSQIAFDQLRMQDEATQALMKETKLVCGDEEITLFDAWEASTSNPYNRFAELVTRIKGIEADELSKGHEARFITITAPSKFHAYHSSGHKNKKYFDADIQATPRDTHHHLMSIWQKVRAQFAKQDIEIVGLRIVEPHHDATPHYHMVIFGAADALDKATAIMKDCFTKEDREELKNNTKVRFDAEIIDKSKGSAVAYVIKYLAKNIVSEAVNKAAGGDNETGTPISDTVGKVTAWARTWGIRQFTFFGGAGVTVWRELRRQDAEFDCALMEAIRKAAHASNWCEYQQLMETMEVKPYYIESFDVATGELRTNQYGEFVIKLKGMQGDTEIYVTREKEWIKVLPKNKARCF